MDEFSSNSGDSRSSTEPLGLLSVPERALPAAQSLAEMSPTPLRDATPNTENDPILQGVLQAKGPDSAFGTDSLGRLHPFSVDWKENVGAQVFAACGAHPVIRFFADTHRYSPPHDPLGAVCRLATGAIVSVGRITACGSRVPTRTNCTDSPMVESTDQGMISDSPYVILQTDAPAFRFRDDGKHGSGEATYVGRDSNQVTPP
jgi:hypothetical protein